MSCRGKGGKVKGKSKSRSTPYLSPGFQRREELAGHFHRGWAGGAQLDGVLCGRNLHQECPAQQSRRPQWPVEGVMHCEFSQGLFFS